MTGIEFFKKPSTTAEEIANIVSRPCPPVTPIKCETITCRECWLEWLATGEAAREMEPSGEQTAPCRAYPRQGPNMKIEEAAACFARLIKGFDDYVNGSAPSHTSQEQ